jgi:hypothetical protein
MLDTRADPGFVPPRVLHAGALPRHTLESSGPDDLIVTGVELKPPTRG